MILSVCVTVTNINDGLLRGISMLNKAWEEHSVPERSTSIVIMLTDGDANVGEAGSYGSESQPECLIAAPDSVTCLLQDLGQLSPGSFMACEPSSRAGPYILLLGLPTLCPDDGLWS